MTGAAVPVRVLTPQGIEAFRERLASMRQGTPVPPATALLWEGPGSAPFAEEYGPVVEDRNFGSSRDAARYLAQALEEVPLHEVAGNVGLWSWLALFHLDALCPPGGPHATRRPGADHRYILDWREVRNRPRHLLYGAWDLYRVHGEKARLLLCGPVHAQNKFYREFVSRQALIGNPGVLAAADRLYYDEARGRPCRGATAGGNSPGTLERFLAVMAQLELTWDLFRVEATEILALLPREFARWNPAHGSRPERTEARGLRRD